MEFEEQQKIEQAIKVLPYIPAEYRYAQAARIAGMLYPQLQSWSPGLARKSGDAQGREVEDISQVVALVIVEVLREYAAGTKHQSVDRWFPYIYRLIQFSVQRYYRSGAVTPMAGRSGLERRVARIPQAIEQLHRELGRPPTAEEVVESHNRAMYARQANPVKHGSLISVYDVKAFL